jgi:hypothetical protein
VTLTDLNTRRIDFSCEALRGPTGNEMVATITNVKAEGPVWRFRNRKNGFYLWSADPAEKNSIVSKLYETWDLEGEAYRIDLASPQNQSPMWRFRNISGGFYLYTADASERDNIVAKLGKTWKLEGEAYDVSTNPAGSPVWRFRNLRNGTYLYTADPNEKAYIVAYLSNEWLLEGPAYYLAQ